MDLNEELSYIKRLSENLQKIYEEDADASVSDSNPTGAPPPPRKSAPVRGKANPIASHGVYDFGMQDGPARGIIWEDEKSPDEEMDEEMEQELDDIIKESKTESEVKRIKEIMHIKENPDTLRIDNKKIWYNDPNENAFGFGYYKNKMVFTDLGKNHTEFSDEDLISSRDDLKTPGRIFPNQKVISFWNLKGKTLPAVIHDINNTLKEENKGYIIDNSWRISVCSLAQVKSKEPLDSERALPLDDVIKAVGSKDSTDTYLISWDTVYDIIYYGT